MYGLLLAIVAGAVAVYNMMATVWFLVDIFSIPPVFSWIISMVFSALEFGLAMGATHPEEFNKFLGRDERDPAGNSLAETFFWVLWAIRLFDALSTIVAITPTIDAGSSLSVVLRKFMETGLMAPVYVAVGFFIAVAPEHTFFVLFDRKIANETLPDIERAAAILWWGLKGLLLIPDRVARTRAGRPSPSSTKGPVMVTVGVSFILLALALQSFNIHASIYFITEHLALSSGDWMAALGIALLITGYQGIFWGEHRHHVAGWAILAIAVDVSTTAYYIARTQFHDSLSIMGGAFLGSFLAILPELLFTHTLRMMEGISKTEIINAIAEFGVFLGDLLSILLPREHAGTAPRRPVAADPTDGSPSHAGGTGVSRRTAPWSTAARPSDDPGGDALSSLYDPPHRRP